MSSQKGSALMSSGILSIFQLFFPVIWLHFPPTYMAFLYSLILMFYFYSEFLYMLHLIQIYQLNYSLVSVQKMTTKEWVRGNSDFRQWQIRHRLYTVFPQSFFLIWWPLHSLVFPLFFILCPFTEKFEDNYYICKRYDLSRKILISFPFIKT